MSFLRRRKNAKTKTNANANAKLKGGGADAKATPLLQQPIAASTDKQRMLAAVLAKQKKNNAQFMSNMKREEDFIISEGKKAKAQSEADRLLALRLQQSEAAAPVSTLALGSEVQVLDGDWCRGVVLAQPQPGLYTVQWCNAVGVVSEGLKPAGMIRLLRPTPEPVPTTASAGLTSRQQRFLESMPADIRAEMMANPHMLAMVPTEPTAPDDATAEDRVLSQQLEFETAAAAAEGADLFGGMTLMVAPPAVTPTLGAAAVTPTVTSLPGVGVTEATMVSASTDNSIPPPAYTAPATNDEVGTDEPLSITGDGGDENMKLRQKLRTAKDMLREDLIDETEFQTIKTAILKRLRSGC